MVRLSGNQVEVIYQTNEAKVFETTSSQISTGACHVGDLDPPSKKRANNVVHVSRLKPYLNCECEEATIDVGIDAGGTVQQAVQKISVRCRINREFERLVQFVGQNKSDAIDNLCRNAFQNCMELASEFDKLFTQEGFKRK